jgi:transposase InsO family protein
MKDDNTLGEIYFLTGLSVSEIKRLVKRFLSEDRYGVALGYDACIPNISLKTYQRTTTDNSGTAGLFRQFLQKYPEIGNKLESWALGRTPINNCVIRGKYYLRIYEAFRSLCSEFGINVDCDYPFTNSDGGLSAVRNYCIEIKDQHPIRKATVDYGDQAGQLCTSAYYSEDTPLPLSPYDTAQLDGHRVDVELTVQITNQFGTIESLMLSRIWLIAVEDAASRAILGHSISLLHNYSSMDVLECIANSLLVTDKEASYGLPSTEIEGCEYRLFNAIKFDNAFAHTSPWLQEKLIKIGIQEVITNRPGRPKSNALLERFFNTFEELTGHRLCITTGSNPKDPRRRSPDKAAKRMEVSLEILEKAFQMAIAHYNSSPHESLNGASPLEFLEYSMLKEHDFSRQVSIIDADKSPLFYRKYPVTVRGNLANGKYPYVQFKSATYTSESLRKHIDLINRKAKFEVNIKDIRFAKLYFEDGTFISDLVVEEKWRRHPHSIKTRQAILQHIRKNRKNFRLRSVNPVEELFATLLNERNKGRKSRNDLLRLSRETGITHIEKNSYPDTSFDTSIIQDHKVFIDKLSI